MGHVHDRVRVAVRSCVFRGEQPGRPLGPHAARPRAVRWLGLESGPASGCCCRHRSECAGVRWTRRRPHRGQPLSLPRQCRRRDTDPSSGSCPRRVVDRVGGRLPRRRSRPGATSRTRVDRSSPARESRRRRAAGRRLRGRSGCGGFSRRRGRHGFHDIRIERVRVGWWPLAGRDVPRGRATDACGHRRSSWWRVPALDAPVERRPRALQLAPRGDRQGACRRGNRGGRQPRGRA